MKVAGMLAPVFERSDVAEGRLYSAMSSIDMAEGPLLKSLRDGIVFRLIDIVVSLVQKFQRLMKAVCLRQVSVDARMIMEILAVIDGGFLDFADRSIDLADRMHRVFVDCVIG